MSFLYMNLNQKIKEFDDKISNTLEIEEVKKIVLDMLGLYKDKNSTLVEVKY